MRFWNNCHVQGIARHWRNPVRTRVPALDSSDALYIVYLAYTVKPMDNVVRFQYPCVRPGIRFISCCSTNASLCVTFFLKSHARGKHDVIVTMTSETYSSW
jgi:hypothetical protein